MATNGNNLEPEFDALLKAHVKQQANVAMCAQFDPDNATAYLEQAMSKAARATFEAHLSTCAVCRRHLLELSRLMPPAQVAESAIVPPTFKERWSEWLSGWRLGALAGLGAVAATVLLFVAIGVNRPENASSMVARKQDEVSTTSLPESAAGTLPNEIQKSEEKPTASSSPATHRPLMYSKGAPQNVPAEPGATSVLEPLARAVNNTAPPPPPVPQPTPAPEKSESERKESAPPPAPTGAAIVGNQANQFRAQTPSGPEANQMQAERAWELRKRNEQAAATADAAASAAKPAAKATEAAETRQVGQLKDAPADEVAKKQVPLRSAAAREKEKIAERPAQPARTIAGKTFRQENSVWIDADYRADRNLPIVRLTRDSDAYKQTLKDFPALQPYFTLYPVVVVWQGKVYRVEPR